MHLFGPARIRPGHPDQPWALWIAPGGDVIEQSTRDAALAAAGARNAVFAEHALAGGGPVQHAVVLHHGYAWRSEENRTYAQVPAFGLKVHAALAELIRTQIREGHLRPGERLPMRRELMDLYRVGGETARRALNLLVEEGLLRREGPVVFVAAAPDLAPLPLPGLDLAPVRVEPAPAPSRATHRARPRHEQLTEILEGLIASGAFPPGSRMPSAREVAAQHDFSVTAAQGALRNLKVKGLTVTGYGDRSYVSQTVQQKRS
ncbi:GntR family transcriptional regulator [Streptomyces sp. NBC_01304]|uniref:GntR family transcriptional regulator n=1 Tax=Streptomyces sp. NBC_01304 TaxID=2903818 RepID=UPI002E0E7412|nr:GntR family transcriptional regulator [Streptomyces sp. NBC_01304]